MQRTDRNGAEWSRKVPRLLSQVECCRTCKTRDKESFRAIRRLEEHEVARELLAAPAAPAVDRTPRVEQLIRNLATANEVITARNPAPIAVPRLQSRSAWINSQLREGVAFETCIEERRVHNARIVAVTMLEELIAAVPYKHV